MCIGSRLCTSGQVRSSQCTSGQVSVTIRLSLCISGQVCIHQFKSVYPRSSPCTSDQVCVHQVKSMYTGLLTFIDYEAWTTVPSKCFPSPITMLTPILIGLAYVSLFLPMSILSLLDVCQYDNKLAGAVTLYTYFSNTISLYCTGTCMLTQ